MSDSLSGSGLAVLSTAANEPTLSWAKHPGTRDRYGRNFNRTVPRTAPVLQDVAAIRSGKPADTLRTDPVAWAYALRETISVARPDVVVSHLDPHLEFDALATDTAKPNDPIDALLAIDDLTTRPPVTAATQLIQTLAGIPGYAGHIAATITSPETIAARVNDGGNADEDELADVVADLLAGVVDAYGRAGATRLVIVEWNDDAAGDFYKPLLNAARHARMDPVVWPIAEPTAGELTITRVPGDTPAAELATLTTT